MSPVAPRNIRQVLSVALLATAGALGAIGTAQAADVGSGSTIVFLGADAREASRYPYVGLIHHFSGDTLANGPLLRLVGYYADYDYDTTAVPGGTVDAEAVLFEAMAGYQMVSEDYTLRGYIGLDYENHDLSPDNPFDSNRGSDVGVKLQGELETDYAAQNYVGLMASYGTAKERYWARARVGHDFSGYVIGGEGLLLGDNEFDERRIGAFLLTRFLAPNTFGISVGYSDSGEQRGGESPYVNLEFSTIF